VRSFGVTGSYPRLLCWVSNGTQGWYLAIDRLLLWVHLLCGGGPSGQHLLGSRPCIFSLCSTAFFVFLLLKTSTKITTVSNAAQACTIPTYQLALYTLRQQALPSNFSDPSTYLHITIAAKVNVAHELFLDCPRTRTTRPAPKIIALSIFIFLGAIHSSGYTPHNEVPQHIDPAKGTRDNSGYISLFDTTLVRKDRCEVEQYGDGRDAKVHVRWPCPCILRPGRA